MKQFNSLSTIALIFIFSTVSAQLSEGPFEQLIIRGVTLINGNGAPPIGPVDVVVEKNIIREVSVVGYPGVEIDPKKRPELKMVEKKSTRMECIYYLVLLICMVI